MVNSMSFFTPREVKRGLRALAIIVKDTFAKKKKNCVLIGSGQRWVAVLFRKLRRVCVTALASFQTPIRPFSRLHCTKFAIK